MEVNSNGAIEDTDPATPSVPAKERWFRFWGFFFSGQQLRRAAIRFGYGCVFFLIVFAVGYIPPRIVGFSILFRGGQVDWLREPSLKLLPFALKRRVPYHLRGALPADAEINYVDLSSVPVDHLWLIHLKPLSNLRSLVLHGRHLGPGLAQLSTAKHLSFLQVHQGCSGDISLLGHLPRLKQIYFTGGICADTKLDQLSSVKSLEFLRISSSSISASQLEQISKINSLTALQLDYVDIDESNRHGVSYLAGMTNLVVLTITGVDDNAAEKLAEIKSLRYMTLLNADLTDTGAAALTKLPHLKSLSIRENLRKLDLKRLRDQMPNCQIDFTQR